jgi:uncharacterized iron-regulated membrane protein
MEAAAKEHGFTYQPGGRLDYDPDHRLYHYAVHSSRDLGTRYPGTAVLLDANTGRQLGLELPTGHHAGNTAANWIFALHMGHVGGLPYRLRVSLLGLAIPALALSGVWIWWKRR